MRLFLEIQVTELDTDKLCSSLTLVINSQSVVIYHYFKALITLLHYKARRQKIDIDNIKLSYRPFPQ